MIPKIPKHKCNAKDFPPGHAFEHWGQRVGRIWPDCCLGALLSEMDINKVWENYEH